MRIVALEEHFASRRWCGGSIRTRSRSTVSRRVRRATWKSSRLIWVAGRLAEMDEAGITMQVLSASGPGAYLLDGADGIAFARDINDVLAKAVAAHPDRLRGLCASADADVRKPRPTNWSGQSVTIGFCGALINGTDGGPLSRRPAL